MRSFALFFFVAFALALGGASFLGAGTALAASEGLEAEKAVDTDCEKSSNAGAQGYYNRRVTTQREAFFAQERPNYTKCLKIKLNIYLVIQALVEGINAIAIAIGVLLQKIIDWVCEAIATTINNLLSKLCIPLPDLSLNFGLPSLERKYCNGIQLITATSGSMSLPEDLDRLKYFDVRRYMSKDTLNAIESTR